MFTWEYNDMTRLDPTFMTHNLVVQEGAKPVQLKRRPRHPKNSLIVKIDIDKYQKVGFIEPIDYSPWLANIIPYLKPNEEIRCCTYFKDLNKVCPKDNF